MNVGEFEVFTSVGRLVAYDYLVIATGHLSTNPRRRSDRLEMFQEGKYTQQIIIGVHSSLKYIWQFILNSFFLKKMFS